MRIAGVHIAIRRKMGRTLCRMLLLLPPVLAGAGWRTPLPAQQLTVGLAADWDRLPQRHPGALPSVSVDIEGPLNERMTLGLRLTGWLPTRTDSLRPPRLGAFVGSALPISIFLLRAGIGFLVRDDPGPGIGARLAVMTEALVRVVRMRTVTVSAGLHTIQDIRGGSGHVLGLVAAVEIGPSGQRSPD
jgi:hypothetical protein